MFNSKPLVIQATLTEDKHQLEKILRKAAKAGDNQTIDVCARKGADVNARSKTIIRHGKSALSIAAENGHTQLFLRPWLNPLRLSSPHQIPR